MSGTAVQCVRVDVFPRRRTRDSGLPNINEGSTTAACHICVAQVWVGPETRRAIAAKEAVPVCDACKPAEAVRTWQPG